ncbi:white collar 2 type of transcription factor [Mycena amicta]|nr:white collar 2 type of transcription factor [Mycena amicta]
MADTSLNALSAAPNFEFGKRKRWADLAITELVDVLLLVLSPQSKILYSGNGLKNTLGWSETDILDCNFQDLIHEEDRMKFASVFEESLQSGEPILSCYVRLKCTSSTPQDLFELVGRPQLMAAEDTGGDNPLQVVFIVAKPFPNKSLETLNTLVELEEEHQRLQQRVAELRARAPRSTPSSPASSTGSSQTSMYATTSMVPKRPIVHSPQVYSNDDNPAIGSSSNVEEDEEVSRKKKIPKKMGPSEQYACITCGRTDSPEWRKGPSGPKTLCNACGLRWAKQFKVQKLAEEAAVIAGAL